MSQDPGCVSMTRWMASSGHRGGSGKYVVKIPVEDFGKHFYLGGDVRIGVRIGGDGQLLSSDAPAAVAAPAAAAADGDDYWAKFSSQGQKLR